MSVRIASGAKADWALGASTNYVNIPEVRKWTLRVTNDSKEYASSSTAGGKQKIGGAENFTGTLDIYIQGSGTNRQDATSGGGLSIRSGLTGTLKLYEDNSNVFLAPSLIDEFTYDDDIEGNGIISGTVTFSRNGALVYPS